MAQRKGITTTSNLEVTKINREHPADDIGALIGLDRLPEEAAADFRLRAWDVYVNKPGAHYEGLLYGANRELGLISQEALSFCCSLDANYVNGPYLEITPTEINIYSTWGIYKTKVKEMSIGLFGDTKSDWHDYHARYIGDVIDIVNTNSSVFSVLLVTSGLDEELASTLIPTKSVSLVLEETVRSRRHKLRHENIVPGSILFNNDYLITEKTHDSDDWDTTTQFTGPTERSEYWVDYRNGYITFAEEDYGSIIISYMYNVFPTSVYQLPIEIYEFADPKFEKLLYSTSLNNTNETMQSLITPDGAGYVNNILENGRQFWAGTTKYQFPVAADDSKIAVLDDFDFSDVEESTYESSSYTARNNFGEIDRLSSKRDKDREK